MSGAFAESKSARTPASSEERIVDLFRLLQADLELEDEVEVRLKRERVLELRLSTKVGALWTRDGALSLHLAVVPRYEGSLERMLSKVLSGERLGDHSVVQTRSPERETSTPIAAVAAFLDAARTLLRRTRALEKEREEEMRGRVRGRLRRREYATRNALTRPWSFPVISEQKDLDHLANRVLKAALLKSLALIRSMPPDTARLVDTTPALLLLSRLRDVEATLPRERDLLRLKKLLRKRLFAYQKVMALAWAVLFPGEWLPPDGSGQRVFFSGSEEGRGLDLFDVAALFERYLGALLKELARDTPGIRLYEETLKGLSIEEHSPSGARRRVPLKLDVPPLSYGDIFLVLDAKYKDISQGGGSERKWEAYWDGSDLTLRVPEGHAADIDLGHLKVGARNEGKASPRGAGRLDPGDLYQVTAYATHYEIAELAKRHKIAVGLVYPSSHTEVLSVVRGLGYRSPESGGVPVFLLGLGLEEERPRLETWLREIYKIYVNPS